MISLNSTQGIGGGGVKTARGLGGGDARARRGRGPAFLFARLLAALLALGALALGAGCSTDSQQQEVKFTSMPGNATVKINGVPAGKTPMSAMLGRREDTIISMEKTGFAASEVHVHPKGSGLTPNPVALALVPEILPKTPGPNPAAELANSLEAVKHYADTGAITPEDRVYMEMKVREFYAKAAPGNAPVGGSVPAPAPSPTP